MSFGLEGKRVAITGGDSGLGLAVARGFVARGCAVTIVSERVTVCATAKEIGARGICCDVIDACGLMAALAELDGLDVAIGNAGIAHPTPLHGGADAAADFAKTVAVNLVGAFHFAQAAAPLLGDGGRLIFTSSNMAKQGHAGFAGYVASKHGLTGLVRSLALELGPRGITVNGICPNILRSDSLERAAAASGTTAEGMSAPLIAAQALPKRLMEAEDLVDTYLFLASRFSSQITGQTISADRGATMS